MNGGIAARHSGGVVVVVVVVRVEGAGSPEREIVTINFPLMGVQHRNEVVREDQGESVASDRTRGNELTTQCVTDINDVTRESTTPSNRMF